MQHDKNWPSRKYPKILHCLSPMKSGHFVYFLSKKGNKFHLLKPNQTSLFKVHPVLTSLNNIDGISALGPGVAPTFISLKKYFKFGKVNQLNGYSLSFFPLQLTINIGFAFGWVHFFDVKASPGKVNDQEIRKWMASECPSLGLGEVDEGVCFAMKSPTIDKKPLPGSKETLKFV